MMTPRKKLTFNWIENGSFLYLTNIPENLHSADLRNYFSYFVNRGAFLHFHYVHTDEHKTMNHLKKIINDVKINLNHSEENNTLQNRKILEDNDSPNFIHNQEKYLNVTDETGESNEYVKVNFKESAALSDNGTSSKNDLSSDIRNMSDELTEGVKQLSDIVEGTSKNHAEEICSSQSNQHTTFRGSCLLIIKKEFSDSFVSLYNRKFWVNDSGFILPTKCLIFNLSSIMKLQEFLEAEKRKGPNKETGFKYRTKGQKKEKSALDKLYPVKLFNIPRFMPQGNVGTSLSVFREYLDQCIMPGSIIKKLKLNFRKSHSKKCTRVYMDYGTEIQPGEVPPDSKDAIFTANGDLIPGYFDIKFNKSLLPAQKPEGPIIELVQEEEEDGAEVEEWERFEAFHEDVTKQERAKERLYETEIEQVWEKGGPGLVFYTDAQFWRIMEGGEEERETDEWDVDTNLIYGNEGGDMDAEASSSMALMDALKDGKTSQSSFVPVDVVDVPVKGAARKQRKMYSMKKKEVLAKLKTDFVYGNMDPAMNMLIAGSSEKPKDEITSKRLRQMEKAIVHQKMHGIVVENHPASFFTPAEAEALKADWLRREMNRMRKKKFKQQNKKQMTSLLGPPPSENPAPIGNFERHTKGFGRRILEQYGWKDGDGLGKERAGISHPIRTAGQLPMDRRGIGFSLEELNKIKRDSWLKKQAEKKVKTAARPDKSNLPSKDTHRQELPSHVAVIENTHMRHTPVGSSLVGYMSKNILHSKDIPMIDLSATDMPMIDLSATEAPQPSRTDMPVEDTAAFATDIPVIDISAKDIPIEEPSASATDMLIEYPYPSATDIPIIDLSEKDISLEDLSSSVIDIPIEAPLASVTDIPIIDLSAKDIPLEDSSASATSIPIEDLSASVTEIPMIDLSAKDIPIEDTSASATDIPIEDSSASLTVIPVEDSSATSIPIEDSSVTDIPMIDLSATDMPIEDPSSTNIPMIDLSATDMPIEEPSLGRSLTTKEVTKDMPKENPSAQGRPSVLSTAPSSTTKGALVLEL